MQTRLMTQRRSLFVAVACLIALFCTACSDPSDSVVLTADLPLHLEDHLDVATIEGSEVPADLPEPVEWRFDEPQPDWKPAYPFQDSQELVEPVRTSDALRITFEEEHLDSCHAVYTNLPGWQLQEWGYVAVEARAQPGLEQGVGLGFNLTEPARAGVSQAYALRSPLLTDGTVQTYMLRPDPTVGEFDGTWRQLLLYACASQPSSLDLLSVKVIPRETVFASAPVGVRLEALGGAIPPHVVHAYTRHADLRGPDSRRRPTRRRAAGRPARRTSHVPGDGHTRGR